jgi:nucleoside-diphosphate-sugar epimerase
MNNSKEKIVITGGSGFLGVNLARVLIDSHYEVCLISRIPPNTKGGWNHVSWDAHSPNE